MNEINDSDLLMYLDGIASPDIQAQIESEEKYRQRAHVLRLQQEIWSSRWFRADCPESLKLGEFYLDRLQTQEKKNLEKHVALCPHCTRELAEIKAFVRYDEEKGVVEVLRDVQIIIAEWVSGKGAYRNMLTPGYRLRGDEKESYQYQAGSAKIALEVKEDEENPGYQALIGIIAGLDAANYGVSLWQAGDKVGSAEIDEFGGFTIGSLQPGEYQLVIHGPKVEIHVQSFVV